jgi:hypothetical protein
MSGFLDDVVAPGEKIVRYHRPSWFLNATGVAATMVVFGLMLVGLDALKTEFDYLARSSLLLLVVGSSLAGAVLVPAMYYFGRCAIVTDRRILVRRGLTWADPITMPLDEIEEIRLSEGLMIVLGRGHKIVIPCWKWMAPHLLEAMDREGQEELSLGRS